MKFINEIALENKRVFIRVDFNVPLTQDRKVADDTRIRACLPTIEYALKQKAKIILAAHLGRPNGQPNEKYSLGPVAGRLTELLKLNEVLFPENCIGTGTTKLSRDLKEGQVMLLENLRFHKGEEANDDYFAKKLAALCEVYINDAFGASHRAHASVVGMVTHVAEPGAGFLMKKEIAFLAPILKNPKRPFVALLGGAKVSDKIGVIGQLLNTVDALCIGGAMAYTFLKALGKKTGASKVEGEKIHLAKKILDRAEAKGIPFYLPIDHAVVRKVAEGVEPEKTSDQNIPEGWLGVDIGWQTQGLFAEQMAKAKTIFWNGPMGVYEFENFAQGTYSVAQAMAKTKAITIVGGGDSASVVVRAGLADKMTHTSTGGGASLEFIEKGTLPGLHALGYR